MQLSFTPAESVSQVMAAQMRKRNCDMLCWSLTGHGFFKLNTLTSHYRIFVAFVKTDCLLRVSQFQNTKLPSVSANLLKISTRTDFEVFAGA